jgi:signal peptidase I
MTEAIYKKSTAREYFESLVITVILALFGTTFIIQAFKIPTPSMEPNLLVGDHLLVNKFAFGAHGSIFDKILPLRNIHRGDVIVFKYPGDLSKHYVKRAIGLPGDHIKVVDRQVFVNGQPIAEPYKVHTAQAGLFVDPLRDSFPPKPHASYGGPNEWYDDYIQGDELVIPPGHYFAMGDNRDNSSDSRYWGFVPRGNIVGRALIIYWSYETPSDEQIASDNGHTQQMKDLFLNFFTKTRWGRELKIIR